MRVAVALLVVATAFGYRSAIADECVARNDALTQEFLKRHETDQAFRQQIFAATRDHGVDAPQTKALWAKQTEIDARNAERLEHVIGELGWPGRCLVGDDAARAAFLILQHAPLHVQKRHFARVEAAVRAGDAKPSWLAYLDDRIRIGENRPQKYGTQMRHEADGSMSFYPIEDDANVDSRRAAVGLEPLSEYKIGTPTSDKR